MRRHQLINILEENDFELNYIKAQYCCYIFGHSIKSKFKINFKTFFKPFFRFKKDIKYKFGYGKISGDIILEYISIKIPVEEENSFADFIFSESIFNPYSVELFWYDEELKDTEQQNEFVGSCVITTF